MRRPGTRKQPLLLLAALVGVLLAGPSLASEASALPEAAERALWTGRFCTSPGCGQPDSAPLAQAAGFAGAALGALWWSRRGDRGDPQQRPR